MQVDSKCLDVIESEHGFSRNKIVSVLTLLIEEECSVPFIARYRKERTGEATDIEIRAISEGYEAYLEREKRRAFILETIEKMGKLTPELKRSIESARTINVLEDIYAPYKAKRKTKGQIAVDSGLQPVADLIKTTGEKQSECHAEFEKYICEQFKSVDEVVQGSLSIIAEDVGHDLKLREKFRELFWNEATLVSTVKKEASEITDYEKYKDYFEYEERVSSLKREGSGHRYLAMRRGMVNKILKVSVEYDQETAIQIIKKHSFENFDSLGFSSELEKVIKTAYINFIHASLDLEIKSELKQIADAEAIETFKVNLKNLLLGPYLGAKSVLGIDPGVRTGCKVVVVDETGKFVEDIVVYPHPPKNDVAGTIKILNFLIDKHGIKYIAIGNGTYGRETLHLIEDLVDKVKAGLVSATLVSESGASIYSASQVGQEEFPDFDPTVRGSISIARRFQDPLAELVKIDPKSIGVGQYQHDVSQTHLKKGLDAVIETCVNTVGVDLNTASSYLLEHISGVGKGLAQSIVKFRESSGMIKSREELLKVPRLTQKIYQQAAGFLRIYGGKNPLDATFIHPEKYGVIENWAKSKGVLLDKLKENIGKLESDSAFAKEVGEFTFVDVINAIKAPSQDPRTIFKTTAFSSSIRSIEDLKIGSWYTGVVTNITQFGAFVDIGIKENGLVHISQLSDSFVKNPLEVVKVGEEVSVRVMEVDLARKRVSLSRKNGEFL